MKRTAVLLAAVVMAVAAAAPSAAEPTSFARASAVCTGFGTGVNFPVVSAYHSDVIYRLTSTGASGNDEKSDFGESFNPGDQVWGDLRSSAVDAGTAPSMAWDCQGGSIAIDLYDRPNLDTPIEVRGGAFRLVRLSNGPSSLASRPAPRSRITPTGV